MFIKVNGRIHNADYKPILLNIDAVISFTKSASWDAASCDPYIVANVIKSYSFPHSLTLGYEPKSVTLKESPTEVEALLRKAKICEGSSSFIKAADCKTSRKFLLNANIAFSFERTNAGNAPGCIVLSESPDYIEALLRKAGELA